MTSPPVARSPHSARSRIGAHVPASGGLARTALPFAAAIGAEAVQVFATNPRGWAPSKGDPAQDTAFRKAVGESLPAYVHASFLINLGSPDTAIADRSIQSLAHTVRRAHDIGARGVVVHTGSAVVAGGYASAMAQTRDLLLPLLDGLSDDEPDVLLEPTAGQGQSLCSTLDELDAYLDNLGHHGKLGLCIDTCHVFAAGHDLAAPGAMNDFLDHLDKIRGAVPLRLIHANDSKDVVGAHKDRHQTIGDGHIGAAPFGDLMAHPLLAGVPLVLETSGDQEQLHKDIALLKSLRCRTEPG